MSAAEVGGFNSQSSDSEVVAAPSDLVGKKKNQKKKDKNDCWQVRTVSEKRENMLLYLTGMIMKGTVWVAILD